MIHLIFIHLDMLACNFTMNNNVILNRMPESIMTITQKHPIKHKLLKYFVKNIICTWPYKFSLNDVH